MLDSPREAPTANAPFPLPLTTFEAYYLADDRPEYPTTFPIELCFSGRLNRELFALALAQAVAIHPLLGARLDSGSKKPQWINGPARAPWLDWADHDAPIVHPAGEFFDLYSSTGLRTWVRTTKNSSRVLMQFHHACCDGLAGMRFVEDLLIFYTIAVKGGTELAYPRRSIARLPERGRLPAGEKTSWLVAVPRDVYVTLWLWSRILFSKSAVLATPEQASASPSGPRRNPTGETPSLLEFETAVIDRKQFDRLRGWAAEEDATFNDLLLREMLLTLHEWNGQHAKTSPGRLRLNVPVNVRPRGDSDMPASNGIGFAFVAARERDFRAPQTLLATVCAQMARNKNWKLALYFLGGLALAGRIRGVVPWALRRKRSFATMVLSNLGRVFHQSPLARADGRLRCGDVVLERVTGVPPIRPLTRAGMAVMEYAGELIVSLRCDPRYFDREQTRQLLDAFVARLTPP